MSTPPALRAPGSWRDPSHVSIARSMILMAAGAVIGLGLAGYALFTARGTSTLYVPPEDVALVNQQPISRVDYLAQMQTLFGLDMRHANAEQRKKVLDDMIREELFVQRGKELDVAFTDPEVRAALVNAVEREIAADALTSQPNDAKLRTYYDAHREKYSREGVMMLRRGAGGRGLERHQTRNAASTQRTRIQESRRRGFLFRSQDSSGRCAFLLSPAHWATAKSRP